MLINPLIERYNKIWANPSKSNSNYSLMTYGYGQTPYPLFRRGKEPDGTPADFTKLVGNIAKHQGVTVDLSDLDNALTVLDNNRMKVDPMELFCSSGGELGTKIITDWEHSDGCYCVLKFDDLNHLKHFFNSGSTIDLEFKVKKDKTDKHADQWQALFDEVGRVKIGASKTFNTGKGSAWKEGAYTLSDEKTRLYTHGRDFNKLLIEGRRTVNSIWFYVTLTSNSTKLKTSQYKTLIDTSLSKGYVKAIPPSRIK